MKKKLAIIVTHPIQYYAPMFKLLSERGNVKPKVFYTWGEDSIKARFDPGFGKTISWDIPLLDGYEFEFLKNTAKSPGSHHFRGVQNPDIVNKISQFGPDAILVYGWSYSSHLKTVRYFKGKIPVWFRGDSTLLNEQSGFKKSARRLFLKLVYRYIDKALYVGSANKAYFKKHGLNERQLIFAPHSTDNQRFGADYSKESIRLRDQLGLNNESILILYAGKFDHVKDPFLLLSAFANLNSQNIHLLFVGNGILETDLKNKVKSERLERMHFMDFQNQSNLPAFYQACDLFCLPSKSETWGLVINEVMAAGKAVLVSDKVGCAADLVKNDINGYIFKSGDLNDLSEKLEKLCSDKTRLSTMGEKSKTIIKDWSFLSQAKAIEDALINE